MGIRREFGWPVVAALALGLWFFASRYLANPARLAREARAAFDQGDVSLAEKLVRQALELGPPPHTDALFVAGVIAERKGDVNAALEYYERIPADGSRQALAGAAAAGDILVKLRRFSDAEIQYRKILAANPQHVLANRRLASILVISGRRRESAGFLFELARQAEADVDEMGLLGNLEQVFDNAAILERLKQTVPQDPWPLLGMARAAIQNNQYPAAIELLRPLVKAHPELWEARVTLGRLLVSMDLRNEFLEWHASLPAELDQNPDVWTIRGRFAEQQGQLDAAIRCYWDALRIDANVWHANYQLSVLLGARRDARAALFAERARHIKLLIDLLRAVLLEAQNERILAIARTMEATGRFWEAWNWYRLALELQPGLAEAEIGYWRVDALLSPDLPQVAPSANPALAVDFSSFPLPDWSAPSSAPPGSRELASQIRFADVAELSGVQFVYDNGADPRTSGFQTWQSMGGGVAVLDYDCDGWPDLHFTQGGQLTPGPGRVRPADQLFRNLGNGSFGNVTGAAGVGDRDFSQGAAAGDFDNDGFADLYIANIGRNRLFHNGGDGTFADVTAICGAQGSGWTASCLIADLNGDGLPDLYDATYLAGSEPLRRLCEDRELHEYRICPPLIFEGEQDRLYLNAGDGTFTEASARSGIVAPDSKSLGVVAADFEERGQIQIFVANDTAANFYFVNENSAGAPPRFSERAALLGCAYNAAGRSHANMGIAVGDADGDGLLDVCVTAFYREYAVLYQQGPAGLFIDRSSEAGLKAATATVLGFGAQFLDADLDGWLDLVFANGHVDDYSQRGRPFRMRPQFFANRGRGRFTELPPAELGEYFERKLLGRGLARLDWNRDGREDFAVSHLDSPAALVTNESSGAGHYLALQLRGVESSRDAVGAVVHLSAGGRTRVQQITAGDGYYASNQKQLIFGLGVLDRIDSILVRWPSGIEQTLGPLPVDGEYLLVEGRGSPVRIPNH